MLAGWCGGLAAIGLLLAGTVAFARRPHVVRMTVHRDLKVSPQEVACFDVLTGCFSHREILCRRPPTAVEIAKAHAAGFDVLVMHQGRLCGVDRDVTCPYLPRPLFAEERVVHVPNDDAHVDVLSDEEVMKLFWNDGDAIEAVQFLPH